MTDERPLCVDLDGTLIRSDLLVESTIKTAGRGVRAVFGLLRSLGEGRAALKHYAAGHGLPDAALLPYESAVVAALHEAKAAGRLVILVTAADRRAADAIAAHLGVFDEVIASGQGLNLKGAAKADALVERFGIGGFDYVGNGRIDLPIWKAAGECWVVEDEVNAAAVARDTGRPVSRKFAIAKPDWRAWASAARVYQWVKNVLVFVPAVAGGALWSPEIALLAMLAFVCFSLFASGTYMLNDLMDLEADRQHPRKRRRAFASGRIPPIQGLLVGPGLMVLALILALTAAPWLATVLILYGLTTMAYTLYLKTKPLVDVYTLAALYAVRIVGGAAATGIEPSIWLLSFSSFLFLGLALLKRFTEVKQMGAGSGRRGYEAGEHILLMAMGIAASFSAAIVFALYAESREAEILHERSGVLWGIVPLLLFWQCRLWLSAWRGYVDDDPIVYAARDWVSWIAIIAAGLLFLAS